MHIPIQNISGVILTGGLSSRMGGGIKSFKKFNNKTIFDRIFNILSPQISHITINSNDNSNAFKNYKLTVIKDELKGHLGPLAGIHATLKWLNKNKPYIKWLLSVPSDTPFLPQNLVKKLYFKAQKNNKKIILAKSNNKLHPVIGLWDCNLLKSLEEYILNGERKIITWARKHSIDIEDFNQTSYDPFFNINIEKDLIKAKEIEDKYLQSRVNF